MTGPCPYCGAEQPLVTASITKSPVPVELLTFCCEGARAKWAEHYDGDILDLPDIELPSQTDDR